MESVSRCWAIKQERISRHGRRLQLRRTDVKKLVSKIPSRLEAIKTTVRSVMRDDIEAICAIEKQCFERPWSKEAFLTHLRKRDCGILTAIQEGQTVGYLVFERGEDFVEIKKMAVNYLYRRCSVGRALVKSLTQRMEGTTSKLTLTVPERNLDAQLFFKRLGYQAVAILRDNSVKQAEDSYIMEYEFASSEPETIKMEDYCSNPIKLIVKKAS